jgi:hypothetical protein
MCAVIVGQEFISAQLRINPSNMGHTHVARPSLLQQHTIRERPEPTSCDALHQRLGQTLGFSCEAKDKLGSRVNSTNYARVRSRQASEKEEERACGTPILTHLPSGSTPPPYMLVYILPTFHVGLNLCNIPILANP